MNHADVSEIVLNTEEQEKSFGDEVSYFIIRNRGYNHAELYLKAQDGSYNTAPLYIDPGKDEIFDIATDAIKLKATRKTTTVEVIGVYGQVDDTHNVYSLTWEADDETILTHYANGNSILRITLRVTETFDEGVTISIKLGETTLISSDDIASQQVGIYEFSIYSVVEEESLQALTAVIQGERTSGKVFIFVE